MKFAPIRKGCRQTYLVLKCFQFISFFSIVGPVSAQTNQWVWIKGDNSPNQYGIYGTKGIPDPANKPGSRYGAVSWTGLDGKFWLFGGSGFANSGSSGSLNDLWMYDPSSNQWTWVKGDNIPNQSGIYGTQGIPGAMNNPGGRSAAVSWTDLNGNLWLMGGGGNASSGTGGSLNDLWKFDIVTLQWIWVNGSQYPDASGIYGTKGVPSSDNKPGARAGAVSWTDLNGNLWLMGGYGYPPGLSVKRYFLNDLWKYDPATNQWTWISGDNYVNLDGTFGTKGISSPNNSPGGRDGAVSWTDINGNLWLMGGNGLRSITGSFLVRMNDLWKFDLSTNEWTWIAGESMPNQYGIYGTLGNAEQGNIPGARYFATTWSDSKGNFWIHGGYGYGSSGSEGFLNDIWKFDPFSNQWTWIKGDSTINQNGNYGAQGQSAPGNLPGARYEAVSWTDKSNNLWIFGGDGLASNSQGKLSDLWKFKLSPSSVPNIRIANPEDKSSFTTEDTISVEATVTGTAAINYVDFFFQQKKFGTDSSAPFISKLLDKPPGTYSIFALAITNNGDTLRSDTITVHVYTCKGFGRIFGYVYKNIVGNTISDLTSYPNFPSNPSNLVDLPKFEYLLIGKNYGTWINAYIRPPISGFYTFLISANTQAELWLSTDENPSNKKLIAYNKSFTGFRQWNRYPTQTSKSIWLDACKLYYIEALHKEAFGLDHLSIGWELPDGKFERPISGFRLAPYLGKDIPQASVPVITLDENLPEDLSSNLNAYVQPNPSQTEFTLRIEGKSGIPIQLKVTDILGRIIESRKNLNANSSLRIGRNYPPGMYILNLIQENEVKNFKLIKE